MKKITTLLLFALMCALNINAQVVIGEKTYQVDTIMQRQQGPGIVNTVVRIPDYPLNVYVLEMDMTNPYNRVETTQAYNLLGKTETLANAYSRHKKAGKKPIAACNSNFWVVSGTGKPYTDFMMGVPFGAEVVNDTLYLNTNTSVDTWNGGPKRTGSTAIDKNKKVSVGRHKWYGFVKSDKFSADQELIQVNKRCDTGQLTLFNHARGRSNVFYTTSTDCHYIFLNFKDGEKWGIATDMKFEVAAITLSGSNQSLGNYDACLVADGDYKPEMEKLAVGDEVVINNYWVNLDGDGTPIQVENMTEGNAYVMLNGELTARNTNESYNSDVYSRTAYGCNADGTKLYMIVIDKATHSEYGKSAGCSTTVMCNILKYLVPDVWNVANYDAGGSAQMMIHGEVINKTTETTPRAVANGMMMFSIAPEEDNDEITTLRFEEPHLKYPIYYTTSPNVLGYNKYGELISESVPVTYSCSENVGTPNADGSALNLSGTPGLGTVTAHYNGIEVTSVIELQNTEFAIRVKPLILIDNKREYPIEITTEANGVTLQYDSSLFAWEVEDETVAVVENGVLKGLKEGTTKIKATIGSFSDETTVKVEIAPSPLMYQSWNEWTVTSANLSSDAVLSEDGTIAYGFGGKRKAAITMEKDVTICSLPDSLWFEFSTTTPLYYIEMDVRTGLVSSENVITIMPDGIETGSYKVNLLDYIGGPEDIATYPVNIKNIMFSISSKSGYTSGDNSISMKLYGQYGNYTSGVESVAGVESGIKLFPCGEGIVLGATSIDKVNVSVYSMSGSVMYSRDIEINGGTVRVEPNLPAGAYVVKATGAGETAVCKMIMK